MPHEPFRRPRAREVLCAVFFLTLIGAPLHAQIPRIALSELGDLRTAFATATVLEEIPGAPLRGEVAYRAGTAFAVRLPMAAQRIEFLTTPGAHLDEGAPVVRLSGPDVHHWLISSRAVAQQFEAAEARYTQNRPLFEEKALSAASWADIQRSYFDLKLENEHREHVLSLVVGKGEGDYGPDPSTLTLGSPTPGLVSFATRGAAHTVEATLFEVIPQSALRMQVDVPWRRAGNLVALRFGDCRVAVEQVEERSDGFFVAAWSESLSGSCARPPGTPASVTPLYGQRALAVPRSAVFQWERVPHVFLRDGDALEPVAVELVGERGPDFFVRGDGLSGESVMLTGSVSAAQGILLGLGND